MMRVLLNFSIVIVLFVVLYFDDYIASSHALHHRQRRTQNNSNKSNNYRKVNPIAYLEPFDLELIADAEEPRYVRTITDRSVNNILLEVPVDDTITVESIRRRQRRRRRSYDDDDDDDDNNDDEEEALAIGLLQLRYEESDNEYVCNVLPKKHHTVWTLTPNLWKETIEILPRCYSETFQATRQKVNKFVIRLTTKQQQQQQQDEVIATGEDEIKRNEEGCYTVDDALWAFSNVRTRSLAVPELINNSSNRPNSNDSSSSNNKGVPLAIIPGLDLFNHAFGSKTKLQLMPSLDSSNLKSSPSSSLSSSMKKWVVSTSNELKAGDEVFLSYGDDKDNWKLLLNYGFAVPNNPNNIVFWTWQDLLDAVAIIRPCVFTNSVCSQLLQHPQLTAYTDTDSESRATFSYDASSDTPRESLSNGLLMLHNLAAQLGKPEAETSLLANEVLDELKRRRLRELQDCLSKLKTRQTRREDLGMEWNAFFNSIRVALECEEMQLRKNTK